MLARNSLLARLAAAAASFASISACWYWRRSVTSCSAPETRSGRPCASRSQAPRERNHRYSPDFMRIRYSMSYAAVPSRQRRNASRCAGTVIRMNQGEQRFPFGWQFLFGVTQLLAPVRRQPVMASRNLVFPWAIGGAADGPLVAGHLCDSRGTLQRRRDVAVPGGSCSSRCHVMSRIGIKVTFDRAATEEVCGGGRGLLCANRQSLGPVCETARPGGPSLRRRVKSVSSASGPAGWLAPQRGSVHLLSVAMGGFLSNIDIAQRAKMRRITEIAQRLGIPEEHLEPFGRYKAKISLDYLAGLAGQARRQAGSGDGDLADAGGRGQDHHDGRAWRCVQSHRQEGRDLPARACARSGVRHEGRGGGRWLRAGGAHGGHQPALHGRLLRHRPCEQSAGRADRQPHPPGQRARIRRAPHHLAARASMSTTARCATSPWRWAVPRTAIRARTASTSWWHPR